MATVNERIIALEEVMYERDNDYYLNDLVCDAFKCSCCSIAPSGAVVISKPMKCRPLTDDEKLHLLSKGEGK